ncbi:MAG: 3-deoxy-8-phosphooctulonate synthase [Rickettsiales bacterium]|jgi:2-dehydro-3-deoxyphosphooctonate aldolase (KDO 8-P synthase)|nr:3-deoxy-8-phosphooctulonate synthase [Rickettsiales bacterium]
MEYKHVKVGDGKIAKEVIIGNDLPFVLISGPCQLQSEYLAMKIAEKLVRMTEELKIQYIFKASFDKANRNSIKSDRGVAIDEGMKIFDKIRETFKCPILTDVHTNEMPEIVASHVDMLQQPAFLIRQTDLSIAIAKTGKACNLKKGQFQAPWDMKNIIEKFELSGNENICLTERGVTFGYGDLIVDTRSLVYMSETGYPIIMDATHSVQKPSAMGDSSGGESRMAQYMARAALSTGVTAGLFIETHPEPLEKGGSDKMNMIPLMYMEELLKQWQEIDNVSKANLCIAEWEQKGVDIENIK